MKSQLEHGNKLLILNKRAWLAPCIELLILSHIGTAVCLDPFVWALPCTQGAGEQCFGCRWS